MNRMKVSDKMRKYLEDKINCQNVIKFIEKHEGTQLVDKIIIHSIPVSIETNTHVDNLREKFEMYDFITESNYTGFEYFPYLYGVLECKDESLLYVFYESFDGNLYEAIESIEHASEWYSIIFQLLLINNYMETSGYQHTIDNFIYKKNPIQQEYEIEGYTFSIKHKYLIVLWNLTLVKSERNIDMILDFINSREFKVPASPRIIKMLEEIKANPGEIWRILDQYYNLKK